MQHCALARERIVSLPEREITHFGDRHPGSPLADARLQTADKHSGQHHPDSLLADTRLQTAIFLKNRQRHIITSIIRARRWLTLAYKPRYFLRIGRDT